MCVHARVHVCMHVCAYRSINFLDFNFTVIVQVAKNNCLVVFPCFPITEVLLYNGDIEECLGISNTAGKY